MGEKKIPFGEFIVLMAMMMSVTALSIDTILPAMGHMASELGAKTENQAQYIISFLFLGFTFGQIIYGPLSDSYGRKSVIYAGLEIFIFGTVLCLMSTNFTLMLVGRLLQGFGVASTRTISVAMIRDLYHGREMARIMSIIMAVFIIVPAIAPSIGQAIIFYSHWRMIFVMYLIVAVLVLVWMFFRLEETLKPQFRKDFSFKTIAHGVKEVVKDPITRGYTICAGLVFGALVGYLTCAQQIFSEYFHAGDYFAAYFAMLALSLGAASILNSAIVRRFGMRRISHYALIAVIAIGLVLCALEIISGHHMPLWQFMMCAMGIFFFMGLLFGNLNAAAMEHMGHIAGVASAVIGAVSSAISVAAGSMIGQFYDGTILPLGIGFVCLATVSFCVQYRINRLPM